MNESNAAPSEKLIRIIPITLTLLISIIMILFGILALIPLEPFTVKKEDIGSQIILFGVCNILFVLLYLNKLKLKILVSCYISFITMSYGIFYIIPTGPFTEQRLDFGIIMIVLSLLLLLLKGWMS